MPEIVKKHGWLFGTIVIAVIVIVSSFYAPSHAQSGQQVQGGAPAGNTDNQYPVDVGGMDSNGKLQHIKVATDGTTQVGGSVGISGTVSTSAPVNPCEANAIQSTVINITTATTTKLATNSGASVITVCGFQVSMVGTLLADTFKLVNGHGTNCATGQADLTGPISSGVLTAGATPIAYNTPLKSAPSGDDICAVSTVGTGPSITGVISWVQP